MSRITTEKYVVADGNVTMLARNIDVFTVLSNGKKIVNAAPGQTLAYNILDGKSIDSTDLATVRKWVFGVAVDEDGDGMADNVRALSGDVVEPGNFTAINSVGATCGVPDITDAFFKCVNCNDTLGIAIEIEDAETDVQFPLGRGETQVLTAAGGVCECDDCDTPDTSLRLACHWASIMKGEKANDAFAGVMPSTKKHYRDLPFELKQLYFGEQGASYTFCFCPDGPDACADCTKIIGIKGITFDADEITPTEVDFNYTIDPSDATKTLIGQIDQLIDQINLALDGRGWAIKAHSAGSCCNYAIEINTCIGGAATAAIADPADSIIKLVAHDDSLIDPCSVTDPGADLSINSECIGCGAEPTAASFNAAVRIIVKPVDLEYFCSPANNTKRNLTRTARVWSVGDWAEGAFLVHKAQKAVSPKGLGYTWEAKEYNQDTGGMGRKYHLHNIYRGRHREPLRGGKARGMLVDKYQSYCVINLAHHMNYSNSSFSNFTAQPKMWSDILIPQGNTTAITSILTFWNAARLLMPFTTVALSCTPAEVPGLETCAPDAQSMGVLIEAQGSLDECSGEDLGATSKGAATGETKAEAASKTKGKGKTAMVAGTPVKGK